MFLFLFISVLTVFIAADSESEVRFLRSPQFLRYKNNVLDSP